MDGDFNSKRWPGPRALLDQRVCRVMPVDPRLTLEYLTHVLPGYLQAVNDHTPSITVKHLSSRTIADLPIPVPPLHEQRQIVEAIETQFSLLDSAIQSLARAKRNVERARASVLKAAVEGRLVPTEAELARKEGREYEHASELLERILAERKRRHEEEQKTAKRKKKYKEPVKPDTEELPKPPEGWVWATVGQLGQWGAGGTPSRRNPAHFGGSLPWVKIGNLDDGPVVDSKERLTELGLSRSSATKVPPGAILLAMYGSIGKMGVAGVPLATNQAVAFCLPSPEIGSRGTVRISV